MRNLGQNWTITLYKRIQFIGETHFPHPKIAFLRNLGNFFFKFSYSLSSVRAIISLKNISPRCVHNYFLDDKSIIYVFTTQISDY